MNLQFLQSSESEANDHKEILYEDQIHYINEFVDTKIIDSDSNKILGFIISETPIFILTKGFNFTIELALAFLKFKNIDKLFCYYRGDVYPVDINRNYIYALNNLNQEEYLLQKRIEYEHKFGITSSDISALYSLSSSENIKAKTVLNWLNSIRDLYFQKINDMNDAKYYDYNYDVCGDIPYQLNDIFNETPAPIKSFEKKYLYAINETWQSHSNSKELIIIWDDLVKKDDIFVLKKVELDKEEFGYNVITINYSGFLKISYKINFLNSEYNRIEMMSLLSKNWDEITDSIAYAYSRSMRYVAYGSAVCPGIIIPVEKNDEIRLHTKIAYNSTKFGTTRKVSTIWRQSSIMIETV